MIVGLQIGLREIVRGRGLGVQMPETPLPQGSFPLPLIPSNPT